MNNTTRKLERKWVANFKTSKLVDRKSQTLRKDLARTLVYGGFQDDQEKNYPSNFQRLYNKSGEMAMGHVIDEMIPYLEFIGISLSAEMIHAHLAHAPDDFQKFCRKCFFILRTIAHAGSSFSIDSPFKETSGDIYFLLRIQTGESISGGQLNLFEDIELPALYKKIAEIPEGYDNDPTVRELFSKLESSTQSFFITGKAGTGKSTFIQYFTQKTTKQVLMLAVTGIAAMNVGGQTIHSFFRLPFKPLLPNDQDIPIFHKDSEKFQIIKNIQTIIIDEVSMLRSDVLDAVDASLRRNGGDLNLPFGGKQILFVGDPFQLPPVVNSNDSVETYVFKEYFKSEYFFDSHSFNALKPTKFEFTKSHRQATDTMFLELLDQVRSCEPTEMTIERLNERYNPQYITDPNEFVINLTTTNELARTENEKQLQALPYHQFQFNADIVGEFSFDKYPTEKQLELKKGAQIIFIKNDIGCVRWVNGTIGKINFISEDIIEISLQGGQTHQVTKVTWENRKYSYNKEEKKIISEVVGTFTQFPLKLAWAITIHKSQSLTFTNLTIDLGRGAFINGQIYTALSRCKTLQGIVLKSRIRRQDIIADQRILDFYRKAV